jgi:hypothetical protein
MTTPPKGGFRREIKELMRGCHPRIARGDRHKKPQGTKRREGELFSCDKSIGAEKYLFVAARERYPFPISRENGP